MIAQHVLAASELPTGDKFIASLLFPDGTFGVLAAWYDKRSGEKFVRYFETEPDDHHVQRANVWLDSGGASSTVPGRR